MNRILASGVGLATTVLLVGACGGAGKPATSYSRAAVNATESPSSTDSSYPEPSGTVTDSMAPGASPSVTDSTMATPIPTPEHAKIKLADSTYGKILVAENDRTLYIFEKDTENTSNCYDTCAVTWPPFVTMDKPQAGTDVKDALLGTTTRKQGEKQVTYNKHPLYYYSGDTKPGDYNGQGKSDSGGKWYVVNADGKKVE
ncbi:COG4315 family predicted lipoprotein [Sphaerisporangium corydalis]|uniref:Lipoprotein n=1 Tax=Sphaerisporangium corydalis TaxID=1441875 RepID=A0ABV9EC61_9ACTN|nr:hypothetical protein [Sphaerisporangium corydalis]